MSRLRVVELPYGDVSVAQIVVNEMRAAGAKHPLLADIRLNVYQGSRAWVLYLGDDPVSIHTSKLGKRKKNLWEPVMNWQSAFTVERARRQGFAYRLYVEAEGAALRAGVRHVKSLAGSSAGLGLHLALKHRCWGLTPEREVFVYSPLPGAESIYNFGATPPQAPGGKLSEAEVQQLIKEGLRYDHG